MLKLIGLNLVVVVVLRVVARVKGKFGDCKNMVGRTEKINWQMSFMVGLDLTFVNKEMTKQGTIPLYPLD